MEKEEQKRLTLKRQDRYERYNKVRKGRSRGREVWEKKEAGRGSRERLGRDRVRPAYLPTCLAMNPPIRGG